MSVVELLDYKVIIACVYRSPGGDFSYILRNLDLVIQKIHSKRKKLSCVVTGI
jgi:hypothetical protein